MPDRTLRGALKTCSEGNKDSRGHRRGRPTSADPSPNQRLEEQRRAQELAREVLCYGLAAEAKAAEHAGAELVVSPSCLSIEDGDDEVSCSEGVEERLICRNYFSSSPPIHSECQIAIFGSSSLSNPDNCRR